MSGKSKTFHYKDEHGEWIPFTVPVHLEDQWRRLVIRLMHGRKSDPHPRTEDYNRFNRETGQ